MENLVEFWKVIKKSSYWIFIICGTLGAGLGMLLSINDDGTRSLDNPFGYIMLFVCLWNILIAIGVWKQVDPFKKKS